MLSRSAKKTFILVWANWPVSKALDLIRSLKPTHMVVQLDEPEAKLSYFLFRSPEVVPKLKARAPGTPVNTALDLGGRTPAPVLDAYADEIVTPPFAVVVKDGYVIGFLDTPLDTGPSAEMVISPPTPKGFASPGGSPKGIDQPPPPSQTPSTALRSVVTDFPPQVALGEIAPLQVHLSADTAAGMLTAELAVGAPLEIRVEALRGFEVAGSRAGSIMVTDEVKNLVLQFRFKAVEVGLGIVRVYIAQAGQSLGSLELEADIVGGAEKAAGEDSPVSTVRYALPEVQTSKGVKVSEPDLSLQISQDKIGGEVSLTFELKTRKDIGGPKIEQHFEPVKLEQPPAQYFQNVFRDIDQNWGAAEDLLAMRGSELFRTLFPEPLRKLLWELRGRIHSVQVHSADPWIPWELCKLQGWENGRLTEGPFLCEQFAVTRWPPQLMSKPTLKLNRIALVVPESSELEHAEDERSYMLQLGNGRQVQLIAPATRAAVLSALASGQFDGWHFTCHGEFHPASNQALLQLEGADMLGAGMLYNADVQRLGLANPLVFLNACQTGQAPSSLSGPAGWADKFLTAAYDSDHPGNGAAAFIGAYWSIDDGAALQFAKKFYESLLKDGKTIGDAVWEARCSIRSRGDGSWLAYTVFAHPLAKVE